MEQCPLARHRQVMSEVRQQAALHASEPCAAILGVFGLAKRLTERPGYRGCLFTLARHEVGLGFALTDEFVMRDEFAILLSTKTGNPHEMAEQLCPLYEGAMVSWMSRPGAGSVTRAIRMTATIVDGLQERSNA